MGAAPIGGEALSMSTLSPIAEAPRLRGGDVQLRLGSDAVAGGRALRLGSLVLTGRADHSLALRTRRTEPSLRHARRPHVEAICPEAATPAAVFRRDGALWELGFGGTVVHMPDLKGLADIATLLANPEKEIHSLDLSAGPASGTRDDGVAAELDGVEGDLGDMIDARARAAYRARVDELRSDIEDARLARDPSRAERAQIELAAIREQLEAAYGLGGRIRRSGDRAERARSAVTARIRSAVRRLESANPALARHLRTAVRTGTWCAYAPEAPVTWQL
jgi:hypothetical protein